MENTAILRAADLMERDVITVTPETRVLGIHRLFIEEEIHGAPVVGKDNLVKRVGECEWTRTLRRCGQPGRPSMRGCTRIRA